MIEMVVDTANNTSDNLSNRAISKGYEKGLGAAMEMIDTALNNPAIDTIPTNMALRWLKAAIGQEVDEKDYF